ncbi:CLUMA_CG011637, isoform A [Clunio marinus]|uniref:CLUMA_CG011637, isoform A n=1 Tax=Clunio marinus TaxID=568069 RepID=A0A1J1IDI2_9DIPT|nr:CLUMA_CG011637, isoform A [Clunio marinus]
MVKVVGPTKGLIIDLKILQVVMSPNHSKLHKKWFKKKFTFMRRYVVNFECLLTLKVCRLLNNYDTYKLFN